MLNLLSSYLTPILSVALLSLGSYSAYLKYEVNSLHVSILKLDKKMAEKDTELSECSKETDRYIMALDRQSSKMKELGVVYEKRVALYKDELLKKPKERFKYIYLDANQGVKEDMNECEKLKTIDDNINNSDWNTRF